MFSTNYCKSAKQRFTHLIHANSAQIQKLFSIEYVTSPTAPSPSLSKGISKMGDLIYSTMSGYDA
ncbi:MAG: hypothetical protein WBP64_03130 [Nitrososphaeraceae archaeon]